MRLSLSSSSCCAVRFAEEMNPDSRTGVSGEIGEIVDPSDPTPSEPSGDTGGVGSSHSSAIALGTLFEGDSGIPRVANFGSLEVLAALLA